MTATTIADLKTARATAGAAYAAAAQAYLDAYAELAAYDMALSNRNLAQGHQPSFGSAPTVPPHGEFLRDSIHGSLVERITARHLELLKSIGA